MSTLLPCQKEAWPLIDRWAVYEKGELGDKDPTSFDVTKQPALFYGPTKEVALKTYYYSQQAPHVNGNYVDKDAILRLLRKTKLMCVDLMHACQLNPRLHPWTPPPMTDAEASAFFLRSLMESDDAN